MNRKNACVISPPFIKICCVGTIITWIITVFLGVLVAQLDPAGPNYDPAGYNPLIDYLSNMGSIYYTPFPFVFNFGMTLIGLLMIPVVFYLKNLMIGNNAGIIQKTFRSVFTILMVIGFIFLIFVGFINIELSRTWQLQLFYPLNACNWHLQVTYISFSSIILGSGVYTIYVMIYPDFFKKILGIVHPSLNKTLLILNTIILPPIFVGFHMSCPLLHSEDLFWISLPMWKWAPFWEWLSAISMTISMFFVCISLIRFLNTKLRNN